jgi:hypothetical protein
MTRTYRVEIAVEVVGESPEDAARQAVADVRDGRLTRTVLVIRPTPTGSVTTPITMRGSGGRTKP